MTEFEVEHRKQGPVRGMFVIRRPGPMFDLGYTFGSKGGQMLWTLELRSKPPDTALRALVDACVAGAFANNVRLVATGRVAAVLEDERYVDARDDLAPAPAPIQREGELSSTPELQPALAAFVAHYDELSTRPVVSERFLSVCAGETRASFDADLSSVRIMTGVQGARAGLRAHSGWVATMSPETLKEWFEGTVAAVPAIEEIHGTSSGSERRFLENQFNTLREKKQLVLRDDASRGVQVRAVRALARRLHPAFVAAAAMTGVSEREDAARRIADAARQLSDVVFVEDAEVLRIVEQGRFGLVYRRFLPARTTTPRHVEVSAALRRMCAIFEWPPSQTTLFEQITLKPVYDSPLYEVEWKPRRGRPGFVSRAVWRFQIDLAGLRRIATGETTHVTVAEEANIVDPALAHGHTSTALRSLIDEGVVAVGSDDEASLAAIVDCVLPLMRELAGATDEAQEREAARRIAAVLREHPNVARVDGEHESFFRALKELLF